MEIEATAATEGTDAAASMASALGTHAEGFGTRPQTGRPHSISLFGPDRARPRDGASRGLDILLGAGIGAAVMYYLDPDGGPQRRERAREKVVSAVTMAPDAFEATAHDLTRWARQTADARTRPAGGEWTPGTRLVASAVGGALTLLAARRRDALGAAVGLIGSALLARGVAKDAPRGARPSQVMGEPVARQLGDSLERPGLLKEM
jgi:hypothetical protein